MFSLKVFDFRYGVITFYFVIVIAHSFYKDAKKYRR